MVSCQENLICRAKELLIFHEHVTEDQAHRLIQKRAMDLRIGKTECAARIIARYNQSLEEKRNTDTGTKTFVQRDNAPFGERFFHGKGGVR